MSINSQAHTLLDVQDDESLTISDPRDGSEVGTLPSANRDQVALAVSLARAVQPEWAATSPADRGAGDRGPVPRHERPREDCRPGPTFSRLAVLV